MKNICDKTKLQWTISPSYPIQLFSYWIFIVLFCAKSRNKKSWEISQKKPATSLAMLKEAQNTSGGN